MILLRVQPVIPWNVLNYMLAVTSCPPSLFFLGTVIGIIPGTMVWLYVGVNLKSIQELITGKRDMSPVEVLFLVLSVLSVFVILVLITRESKV